MYLTPVECWNLCQPWHPSEREISTLLMACIHVNPGLHCWGYLYVGKKYIFNKATVLRLHSTTLPSYQTPGQRQPVQKDKPGSDTEPRSGNPGKHLNHFHLISCKNQMYVFYAPREGLRGEQGQRCGWDR